ncbi:MAG: peptide-methionine (S)-S-oxide reductase MsrA [Planctomycetes bacterium]|nr:peptide-methionine (S)-S-oxide reductase MsrA [Planctomycetota bacterium]
MAPPPLEPSATTPAKTEIATFAAGCFWCSEAVLLRVDGVLGVVSGYMGGALMNPTYEQVCSGITGHAEAVQVTYDPARVSFARLCELFFALHDPTTLNRQGNDVGTQYRSAIFFHDAGQREAATAAIAAAQPHFDAPIVTEVTAASRFWPAEAYHQNYFAKNPDNRYCRIMIPPKLKKLGLDGR